MNAEFCQLLAKIIIQIQRAMFKQSEDYYFLCRLGVSDLNSFVHTAVEKKFSWEYIRTICNHHFDCNQYWYCISYSELMELFPYQQLDDSTEIEKICKQVIEENPKSVVDYKKGKTNSINHLKGQVMKMTKGKVNIQTVNETLTKLLTI